MVHICLKPVRQPKARAIMVKLSTYVRLAHDLRAAEPLTSLFELQAPGLQKVDIPTALFQAPRK